MGVASGGTRNVFVEGIEGAKKTKLCQKWLILTIFSFKLGDKWGAEPPTGEKCPHTPLDAAIGGRSNINNLYSW